MSVYDRISDRTRPWETVWDRTRPYIQPHMKSTPRVSSTVSISYINRMESCETVPKSYIQHPIHTSVHTVLYDRHTTNTVSYDRHTTNTVPVRIIHGQVRPDTVSSSVQSSCMIIQHSNTTENTTTCCHLETTEYLLHNASKEEGPKKNPLREYKKGHQGRVSYWPNMTLLWSHSLVQTCLLLLLLLLACSCLPSRLLAKIISMSISLIMISNSHILSSAILITSLLKVRKFMNQAIKTSQFIKTYTNVW